MPNRKCKPRQGKHFFRGNQPPAPPGGNLVVFQFWARAELPSIVYLANPLAEPGAKSERALNLAMSRKWHIVAFAVKLCCNDHHNCATFLLLAIMSTTILATFVTTTTYGTWLPGDARWYVEHKQKLPPNPKLHRYAQSLMKQEAVYLQAQQQDAIFDALCNAAKEFHYRLSEVAVESWHLHWTIWHGCDKVKTMVGRLKNRMRQKLSIGRIWTHGYCYESLDSELSVENVRQYIGQHHGCRMIDGVVIERSSAMHRGPRQSVVVQPPGGAGG